MTVQTIEGRRPQMTQFEDFYRANWSAMVRLAWFLCGSRQDGEDVVHDAFVRLEEGYEQFSSIPTNVSEQVYVSAREARRMGSFVRRPPPDRLSVVP